MVEIATIFYNKVTKETHITWKETYDNLDEENKMQLWKKIDMEILKKRST